MQGRKMNVSHQWQSYVGDLKDKKRKKNPAEDKNGD